MQVLILTKMQVIQKKRNKIADFYIKSAQLEGSNEEIANQLDEIVEDGLFCIMYQIIKMLLIQNNLEEKNLFKIMMF